tara:strand:- start:94 stop:579 length:486 start_codon:yes stop_codon:yes gene_type:complete
MFLKTVMSFLFLIFSAGAGLSYSFAAPIEHHHTENVSHEILITKLNINLSEKPLNQPQHFCPVYGRIMKGAFCKMKQMKHASANPPDSAHEEIEECFISVDEGTRPLGTVTTVIQLDYKFAVSTMLDMALLVPCGVFSCFEFKGYSQEYFNPPDKPPKRLS